jgi:type IX secretion system substrate protein
MEKIMNLNLIILLSLIASQMFAQLDTVRYQWPVTPLNSSHSLTATFSEFRNTLSSDHFHNAVDISEPDGEPCYAALDGEVFFIDNSGSNSYVSVATNVNSQWKRLTYLHIAPNPSLSVGNQVTTGVTILGTIYPGMGHVHLIEREFVNNIGDYAAEINNARSNGGLTPYIDNEAPAIDRTSLKFFIDGTSLEVPKFGLTGRIDIQVKIEERNGPSNIHRNNGTYIAGYRVWSPDTSQIIYEPANSGIKYRFDKKPFNSYVHRVFVDGIATLSNPVYWLTNGNGADEINQTQAVTNNYFEASVLDTGNYVLEIFTEDTRGNQDIEYFDIGITDQDLTPPSVPEIFSIVNSNSNKSVTVEWNEIIENDLLGYRLYYSPDNQLSSWELAADESQLNKDSTSFFIESPDSFVIAPAHDVYYFKLTAIDSSGNESNSGDIYGRSLHFDGSGFNKALIVNGFTRYGGSGSWQSSTHAFVKSYFDPLMTSDSVVISSCSNEAVIQNKILLADFDIVVWFVGDESTIDDTFTPTEQNRIVSFLENGGKLFVSGSEIGWDIGRSHSSSEPGDMSFYNNYFKANFVDDGNTSMSPATGTSGTLFSGTQLNYGQVYQEDYPDDIDPNNGSNVIMQYNQIRTGSIYRKAGVAYTGIFGSGQEQGQLIYLSFPFETINSLTQRQNFMNLLLGNFGVLSNIDDPNVIYPQEFSISQNYPNPFNPSTRFKITLPKTEKVSIKIFDMLGREVKTITNKLYQVGIHTFTWHAHSCASGVYFIKMQAGSFYESKKMLLLK